MKKSSQVPATLIVTLTASIVASGCGSQTATYECRDAYGRILPYSACRGTVVGGAHFVQTGGFGSSGSGGGGFFGG